MALLSLGVCAAAAPSLPLVVESRIEAEIVRLMQAKGYAFLIVEDPATHHYVQFAAADGAALLDLPVAVTAVAAKELNRDAGCGTTALTADPGESERLLISPGKVTALKAVLTAEQVPWKDVYCLQRNAAGARHGYTLTLRGLLRDPKKAARLTERLFVEAYGATDLGTLQLKTEQGAQ